MARKEYGVSHQPIRPLWASTTWNSWMRSRFVACVSSRRSASPRVPTSEKARSRRSAAKSSQAAMTSRLWAARSSGSRRRQAGSTFRNVYLTKWRSGMPGASSIGEERLAVPRPSPAPHRIAPMRVALVSPYSWTYPGGVTRHIEALARRAGPRGARRDGARAVRCRPAPDRAAAPRSAAAGARRAGVAGPAREHDRVAVERRGVERRRPPERRLDAAPRAARRAASTSSTSTSRSRPSSAGTR